MPDFQPTDGIVTAIVKQVTWDNQTIENVFHVDIADATLDQSVADSIAAELRTAYSELAAHTFSGNDYVGCDVIDSRIEDGPGFVGAWANLAGTDGADPLPGQNAALISWKTSRRGASFRGRTYIGGLTEAGITSGLVAAAVIADLEDFADIIVAGVTEDFVVLSRVHNKELREVATGQLITSYSIPTHVATQRRRRT